MLRSTAASFAVLLVLLARGAAAGKMHHRKEHGGQHEDAHVDGFVLKSAFIHVEHENGDARLHRRMLQFDENPHLDPDVQHQNGRKVLQLQPASFPDFDTTTNSRDRECETRERERGVGG